MDVDPHMAPSDNEIPMDLWRQTYGKMYKKLFEAGVPTIMIGHNNLTSYQTEKIDGAYPPATMSYELTTKLLREELGFRGVTVTDALVMGGFGGAEAVNNTVLSFLAGNDMLLWPSYEYIDEMERRILSGEIDEAVLDAAVERIWNLKKEYGILDGKSVSSDKDVEFFSDIAKKTCEKSLTLLNNYKDMLPLERNKIKNVFIIGVTPDNAQYEALCVLKSELEKYGCNVKMQRNAWTDEAEKASAENDLVIFALCRTPHYPIGPLEFWGDEALSIWASNCTDKSKTVIASFGSPYLYKYYKVSGTTYVNAYNYGKDMISAFVRALFGECEFCGRSSVGDCT
jgi:beta-N-acetylhexosaminidase